MKILLVCSVGMSTDILRGELIKYAKKEQLPLEVKAVGVHAYRECCTGYDVILLGPQIAYRREKIAAECGNRRCLPLHRGLCSRKCRTYSGTGRDHIAWIRKISEE